MMNFLIGLFTGLPLWGILGFLGSKFFSPLIEELALRFKNLFLQKLNLQKDTVYQLMTDLQEELKKIHRRAGHGLFKANKPYFEDQSIRILFSKNQHMLHGITREWINIIPIRNYDDSDIYFAGLELLTPQLSKKLVKRLYQLHQKNNQAALFSFLEELQKKNPKILNKAILSYLNKG